MRYIYNVPLAPFVFIMKELLRVFKGTMHASTITLPITVECTGPLFFSLLLLFR